MLNVNDWIRSTTILCDCHAQCSIFMQMQQLYKVISQQLLDQYA